MSAAIVGREDELAAIAQFLSRDDWPRTPIGASALRMRRRLVLR